MPAANTHPGRQVWFLDPWRDGRPPRLQNPWVNGPLRFPSTSRALVPSCLDQCGLPENWPAPRRCGRLQAPSAFSPSQPRNRDGNAAARPRLPAHLALTPYLPASCSIQCQGPRPKGIDPSQLPSLGHWHLRSAAAGYTPTVPRGQDGEQACAAGLGG